MANICDYEIRIKGNKKAAYFIYDSTAYLDYKDITYKNGTDTEFELRFCGDCKWSVNWGVNDETPKIPALKSKSLKEVEEISQDYYNYSLRGKSDALQCEILVHYYSEESNFDQFDGYRNGECFKQRKILFDNGGLECPYCGKKYDIDEFINDDGSFNDDLFVCDCGEKIFYMENESSFFVTDNALRHCCQTEFDWDTLEFTEFEGVYDDSVTGEQDGIDFLDSMTNRISSLFGGIIDLDDLINDDNE